MSDAPPAQVVPAEDFKYYSGKYWNNLDLVVRELNRRATGDAGVHWHDHLREVYGTFDRALILNCGNGWVERDLFAKGVIRSAAGADFSAELVEEARQKAAEAGMPAEYIELDTNTAAFPDGPFDLVVNHAALHHVAYLDRVARRLCDLLAPDGVMVSWDYVGPHRNQYPAETWEAAWQVNLTLPEGIRQQMRYPHLPTMLATDPTEAVHSELIRPVLRRYFRTEHFRYLGGAIGYLLLTHNEGLHGRPEEEVAPSVAHVMEADGAFTDMNPESSLFAYWIARPDPDRSTDPAQLDAWSAEEDEREASARAGGGVYYPRTSIAALSEALSDAELALNGRAPAEAEPGSVPAPSEPPVPPTPAPEGEAPLTRASRQAALDATPGRELLLAAISRLATKTMRRIESVLLKR